MAIDLRHHVADVNAAKIEGSARAYAVRCTLYLPRGTDRLTNRLAMESDSRGSEQSVGDFRLTFADFLGDSRGRKSRIDYLSFSTL